jgi:hypothetical protein
MSDLHLCTQRNEAVTAVSKKPFSAHSSSQNRISKISLIFTKIIIQIIIFSLVIISTLEIIKILYTNSYLLVLLAYLLFHKNFWFGISQNLRNFVNSEISKNYFLHSFIDRGRLEYKIYSKYIPKKVCQRNHQVVTCENFTDCKHNSTFSSFSLSLSASSNLDNGEFQPSNLVKTNNIPLVNKFKSFAKKYLCNNHTSRHLPASHRLIYMSQNNSNMSQNSMVSFLNTPTRARLLTKFEAAQAKAEETIEIQKLISQDKNKSKDTITTAEIDKAKSEYNNLRKENVKVLTRATTRSQQVIKASNNGSRCSTEVEDSAKKVCIKQSSSSNTPTTSTNMTINTNETANTSSSNNQDDNIGVLASEKTVSILSTTNKEGVSQKPKLKNNETSNHTIDDLTLKVHELTTIPVTPIPKLPDIYADSSTASNNNPLRNNKRVKGDESPNSDGSHPSSQHGQYVTVSNKKAEKRRKKAAEFPTMSTPEKDINFSTSRQVQYDAKLQQLQNRVFDISRHDHLPQYSALSPPDEKLSTHLIRSKHVILSGFHGAHAYNDNILGDIIREEVDAALKLIGYHDAIALWRHISTELPPTSDSYQSGVKVNWNASIRIINKIY